MILRYIIVTTPALLGYLAYTGNIQPANIVVGLLLSLFVIFLIRPRLNPPHGVGALARAQIGVIRYVLYVAWDVIKNAVIVAGTILNPRLPIEPKLVKIDAGATDETTVALSAHAITLSPGEMVVDCDGPDMYVHCLNATRSEPCIQESQEVRRAKIREFVQNPEKEAA